MARVVTLGKVQEDVILVDQDDFVATEVAGQSIFARLTSGGAADIDQLKLEPGGAALNAAICFARNGHESIVIGNISRDAAGEAVLACLDDENIDSSYINLLRGGTACSVILVDAKTRRPTRLNFQGVARKTTNIDANDLELISPDWLYAGSLAGDMEKLLEFFTKAHALGARVMFNPGPAELAQSDKLMGLLEDVDILYLNKAEAAQLVPGVLLSELLVHLSGYCRTVVITDGEMGTIATNHDRTYRLGVYEPVRVKDLTGVGDAFGAGLLTGILQDWSLRKALHFASANATSVIQRPGARAGILTVDAELHPMPIQLITDLIN